MPELPEVETICNTLKSIVKRKITAVFISNFKLRCPIPKNIPKVLKGEIIQNINRRGKYILLKTDHGTLIIHLGMSGNLQIKNKNHAFAKHEHVNIFLNNGLVLCYNDPRRFGAILWTTQDPLRHRLLENLGVEPFDKNFTADFLLDKAKTRRCSIKQLLMDNHVVTGIGNIYANEILFAAKINPLLKVNLLSWKQCQKLVKETKRILTLAIKHRGTTIKDHTDSHGKKGLFQNKLKVYNRSNQPCINCKTRLAMVRIGQRSTVFCPKCQRYDVA